MKNALLALIIVLFGTVTSVQSQEWNRDLYPDYNPTFSNPDPSLIRFGLANTRRRAQSLQEQMGLPSHVNNANTPYFPPVFNQSGGSCGSASRIAYMFTHEINTYRGQSADGPEHYYPTHFVWLLTNGNSGKDEFVTKVGVPSAATYGGQTYSSLLGYSDCADSCFGWMNGYDKWYEAMCNRMTSPTSNPYHVGTEAGRLAAKAWLYNHAGDTDFKAGGLIGLGVASGGSWGSIASTPTNDSLGVTGMYYVQHWGSSVDHAVTMVGYDDRIEFDIDGNGIYGETDKDEVGAWIIVNSWGGWCNNGFIYCPYAMAGPVSDATTGKLSGGYWYGELYHTRKNYRPLRTIKLEVEYNRRSELYLSVGVSSDLNATVPEKTTPMEHFKYAGDGNYGNTVPAPLVPMLGKWADGKMHSEPMEFGYDVTDLSSGYDKNQPLKYFFIVTTKSTAIGKGYIRSASIIDYEHDTDGVDTPFTLDDGGTAIQNGGTQTIISTIVQGGAYYSPRNLALSEGQLTWDEPLTSGHTLQGYNIYHDGTLLATVGTGERQYSVSESGTYGLSAIYENQTESNQVTVSSEVLKAETNQVINLKTCGFSIPDIFDSNLNECTIEFYIKPTTLSNYNNAFGPGWGTFYAHCNENKAFTVGWDTSNRTNSSTTLSTSWKHVAIVVNNNTMTLYFDKSKVGTVTSQSYSGIGGFGNLTFSGSGSGANNCMYDEIRIWDHARTASEVSSTYNREFYGEVMPDGLVAYYKGDIISIDGNAYLRDCVGGHHALISNTSYDIEAPSTQPTLFRPKDSENILSIDDPGQVNAGMSTQLTATRGDGIRTMVWNIPALGIKDTHLVSPCVVFPKAGTYEVSVTGWDYEADGTSGEARTISDTLMLTVNEAPDFDAQFTCSATEVPAGDRVYLYASNPKEGYSYKWSLPGADVEEVATPTAGVCYQGAGTYTITLTVTAPDGQQKQESANVTVSEVAPVADFTVTRTYIQKGQSTALCNASKYRPTSIEWTLASSIGNTIVQGGETYVFTPQEPGVYDVTLKAVNKKGTNSKTLERAIHVANADSKNGLTFSQQSARVATASALTSEATVNKLTIDWWMKPSKLSDYCLGLGESITNLLVRTASDGSMTFQNGTSRKVTSESGYVIEGQWHHYAVVYNGGKVSFYRDGVQVGSQKSGAASTTTLPTHFSIGTSSAEMNGSIDEFRIWNTNLSKNNIQSFCNEPMDDPERYITGENANYKLLLYYQFNQSGGDVIDATSYGNNGIRSGFGPEGDAWDLSQGVFCLNFGAKQDDVILDDIQGIRTQSAPKGIYTLTGVRVTAKQAQSVPGIYIVDGKKTVIQ